MIQRTASCNWDTTENPTSDAATGVGQTGALRQISISISERKPYGFCRVEGDLRLSGDCHDGGADGSACAALPSSPAGGCGTGVDCAMSCRGFPSPSTAGAGVGATGLLASKPLRPLLSLCIVPMVRIYEYTPSRRYRSSLCRVSHTSHGQC
jgi:hypothetical protein